ncbi:MAG: hypothetical protein EXR86_16200 [Gammaproteobacteria bacterium]|nr:hypothetical protein [Gammaproteobacteria bacterium]
MGGVIAAEDQARVRYETTAFVNGGTSEFSTAYQISHKNGGTRRVLDCMRCLRNPQGRALEIVGAWIALSNSTYPL